MALTRNQKIAVGVVVAGAVAASAVMVARVKGGAPSTINYSSQVVDGDTLLPISGATVLYDSLTMVTTDGAGRFALQNAPLSGQITISAGGYNAYGPVLINDLSKVTGVWPLAPSGGGIPYSQSFVFESSSEGSVGAEATYKNQNTVPITAACWCDVKNNLNQSVVVGHSTLQTVSPGSAATLFVPLAPALPSGTYVFTFFMLDANNGPVSEATSVTFTVP